MRARGGFRNPEIVFVIGRAEALLLRQHGPGRADLRIYLEGRTQRVQRAVERPGRLVESSQLEVQVRLPGAALQRLFANLDRGREV